MSSRRVALYSFTARRFQITHSGGHLAVYLCRLISPCGVSCCPCLRLRPSYTALDRFGSFAWSAPHTKVRNPHQVSLAPGCYFHDSMECRHSFHDIWMWRFTCPFCECDASLVSYRHFAVTLDLSLMFKCTPDSCTVLRDSCPPGSLSSAPRWVGAFMGSVVRLGRPRRPGRM